MEEDQKNVMEEGNVENQPQAEMTPKVEAQQNTSSDAAPAKKSSTGWIIGVVVVIVIVLILILI